MQVFDRREYPVPHLAKAAHPGVVDRPGAVTDAAAALLSVAADTAMC